MTVRYASQGPGGQFQLAHIDPNAPQSVVNFDSTFSTCFVNPNTSKKPSLAVKIGALVGGVLALLALIAFLARLLNRCIRRRRTSRAASARPAKAITLDPERDPSQDTQAPSTANLTVNPAPDPQVAQPEIASRQRSEARLHEPIGLSHNHAPSVVTSTVGGDGGHPYDRTQHRVPVWDGIVASVVE